MIRRTFGPLVTGALLASTLACSLAETPPMDAGTEPVEALRTPEDRFSGLPGFPHEPHYAEVPGGLRMAYIDEGPQDGPPVVLLHGEPSWSFLYRKMIPVLTARGFRVIAPDLIGFGRSDKPVDRAAHTYAKHVEWVGNLLLDHLELQGVNLFAQDWGGLIGLRIVAENPDRFARVAIGNTGLPTGSEPPSEAFLNWRRASQNMPVFDAGMIVQTATVSNLGPEIVDAYNAPFPDSTYQAGARVMPVLVPISPDDPAAADNRRAWESLRSWSKPFATFFSDSDPITGPWAEGFRNEVPGAAGQPHDTIVEAGHFLQEDKGEELAERLASFFATPLR